MRIKHYLLFPLLLLLIKPGFSQTTNVASELQISKEQLAAFQQEAEKKKKQFVNCILRVSRNKDIGIRRQNMEDGVALFEDTAHIAVSNKNSRRVTRYSVKDYFFKIVANYYNEFTPTVIEITSTPVVIDEVERDAEGNPIAIVGHFEYTQRTTKCKGKQSQLNSDVPLLTDCYHDVTTKQGRVRIAPRPTSQGAGYSWVVLISGIVVNTTE